MNEDFKYFLDKKKLLIISIIFCFIMFIILFLKYPATSVILKPKCAYNFDKNWKIAAGINGNIFFISEEGNYYLFLEDSDYTLNYPTFSPKGEMIGYCKCGNGYFSIVIHNLKNGKKEEILKTKNQIRNLSWSPDGEKLLFLTDYNYTLESMDLCIIHISSKKVDLIANDAVNAVSVCTPSWCDNRIIFTGLNNKIVQINPDNNETQEFFDGTSATCSPSGKYIVYRKGKNTFKQKNNSVEYILTGFKYYLYDIETRSEKYLFNGKSFLEFATKIWQAPIWSPDSRYILFFKAYDHPYKENIYAMDILTGEICLFTQGTPHSSGAISWISE